MKRKIVAAIMAAPFVLGMLALQGCYETNYPAYGNGYGSTYGYGYGRGPAFYASAPVYAGDWHEHQAWHDHDWWEDHHRDSGEHHHEWLEHHDRD